MDRAEAGHHVVPDPGGVIAVRARGDVVIRGRAAEPVQQRAGVPDPAPAELLIELRGVAGPLGCRTRCAAHGVPAAVLDHVVSGRGVGLERDVGDEAHRARRHATAHLKRRPREHLTHSAARSRPAHLGAVTRARRAAGGHPGAARGSRPADAHHVRRVRGVVDGQDPVAVEAAVVAGGREPRLPDGVRVRDDRVIRQLRRRRDADLARPPARRYDVTGIVGDDAVVHGREVWKRRRRRHVVENARAGRGRMRVLDVERDLDRVLHAELAAGGVGRAGAHLTASGGKTGQTPLRREGGVVGVLPGIRAGDDDGFAGPVVAGRVRVEGDQIARSERTAVLAERRARDRLDRPHARPSLGEVVEPDHADDRRCDVGRQRRLVDRRVVHAPAALDRMNFDAEGAFEGGHVADGTDHEPVREAVRHAESARHEMVDDGSLVRLGRSVERVELLLRQEAMVRRRRRILDVVEELLEPFAVTEGEPDDDPMPIERPCPAMIRRGCEKRRTGARLHDVGRMRGSDAVEPEHGGDDRQRSPPNAPARAARMHHFRDSGRPAGVSNNAGHRGHPRHERRASRATTRRRRSRRARRRWKRPRGNPRRRPLTHSWRRPERGFEAAPGGDRILSGCAGARIGRLVRRKRWS